MAFDAPILALETSCDESAAAVVRGRTILSNIIASQIDLHAQWGGVVPEAAARVHVEAILPVLSGALDQARLTRREIGAIAVTNRPGLIGALSVGVTAAKVLARALEIPLIGIHHIEGHLASVLPSNPSFPLVALVVSGGHSEILWMSAPTEYRLLGETRDDAAGEALDKSARLLGLAYPGGRALSDLAHGGDADRYPLPRALDSEPYEMSFSGLKTAVLRTVEREGEALNREDLAASVLAAVVDALARRIETALQRCEANGIALVGGVAANWALRKRVDDIATHYGKALYLPPPELCTDNAAMIGLAAAERLARGDRSGDDLEALATAELPGLAAEAT